LVLGGNMKRADNQRHKLKSKFGFLAISVVMIAPLTACNSTGFSDFAGGIENQRIAQTSESKAKTYSSVYQQGGLKPIADGSGIETRPLPAPVQLASENTAASSGVYLQKPATVESVPDQPVQMARLAPVPDHTGSTESGLYEQAYAPPALSPEEIAAQEAERRIESLAATIKHGKCKSGWGKQARKLDANRYTPGHPYYMEIRMRHTPPLPVGHTYTAYGRLDENGKKLNENLVMLAPKGGYAGATMASTIPMPSVMEPTGTDCASKPVAAYRVSLSAVQYEKLLREIKQAKKDKPRYQLFLYNCNHFTSRISESVGIKTPKNKYTSSLVYMYDIIRENEGRNYKLARR